MSSSRIYQNLTECILDLFTISVRNQTIQDGIDRNITIKDNGIISLYIAGCTELVQGCAIPKTYDTLIKRLHNHYNKLFPEKTCDLTTYVKRIASSFIPSDYADSMGLREGYQMSQQIIIRVLKNSLEIISPYVRSIMDGNVMSNSDIYITMGKHTYIFLDQLQAESIKRLMGSKDTRGELSIDPAILESMKIELRKALEEKIMYKYRIKELEAEVEQLKMRMSVVTDDRNSLRQVSTPRQVSIPIRQVEPAVIDLSNETIYDSEDDLEIEAPSKQTTRKYASLAAEIDEINV